MQAASDQKATVFVSYRREGGFVLAKYIFDYLHAAGYDVFMDVHSLGAGEFEQTILAEVAARQYFLLVLTSGSLDGMIRERDWLRKELTQAVESGRTVVPVLAEGFKFEDHKVQEVLRKLPPALQVLPSFNAVRIPPPEYFDSAMERLRSFLKAIAGSAPGHGTDKSSAVSAVPESVAQVQSALRDLRLPPVSNFTDIQSATPWSDLHATLADRGAVGVDAPALKKSSPALPRPAAPILKKEFSGLTWTEVSEADHYVLEESGNAEFKDPRQVVYQGPMTFWISPADLLPEPARPRITGFSPIGLFKYYRVRAIGKGAAGEGDWSNIVKDDSGWRDITILMTATEVVPRLPAPVLKKEFFGLTWTKVSEVDHYILEESGDAEFKDPAKAVYQGPKTVWISPVEVLPESLRPSLTPLRPIGIFKYYRVKAIGKGAAVESDWSNIVKDPP